MPSVTGITAVYLMQTKVIQGDTIRSEADTVAIELATMGLDEGAEVARNGASQVSDAVGNTTVDESDGSSEFDMLITRPLDHQHPSFLVPPFLRETVLDNVVW